MEWVFEGALYSLYPQAVTCCFQCDVIFFSKVNMDICLRSLRIWHFLGIFLLFWQWNSFLCSYIGWRVAVNGPLSSSSSCWRNCLFSLGCQVCLCPPVVEFLSPSLSHCVTDNVQSTSYLLFSLQGQIALNVTLSDCSGSSSWCTFIFLCLPVCFCL